MTTVIDDGYRETVIGTHIFCYVGVYLKGKYFMTRVFWQYFFRGVGGRGKKVKLR
jgi:hypothetical protein